MDSLIDYLTDLFGSPSIQQVALQLETWLADNVLDWWNLVQLGAVVICFVLARLSAPLLLKTAARLAERRSLDNSLRRFGTAVAPLTLWIAWLVYQWLAVLVARGADWPHHLMQITVSLLTAWIAIRLVSRFVRDPVWSRMIAVTAWTVAALNILGLLDDTIEVLDAAGFTIGDLRISVFIIVKGMLSLAIFLWLASLVSRLLERRINTLPSLTPSVQVLLSKLLKVVLITIAVVVALRSVGIDLTAFAVLSGAIGVGIGFGLQKAVSNLISGVMLLLDKSIKPGDVISVAGTYGWVSSLGARYVSVVTRDGIEHLIPNEDFITQGVENWSFSDQAVRLRIPIGISYKSDVRQAIALCLEAAAEVERVLATPKSVCLLKGFGDSAVDLELRFWINDPQAGVSNVKSQILLGIWDRFHEHGIEIPFPQHDLHIKPPADIGVRLSGPKSTGVDSLDPRHSA